MLNVAYALPDAPKARRGRPAIVHCNRRVQAFLRKFDSFFDLAEELPDLDDVLTGITYLQTEGQDSTRPLSRRMLFRVLQECDSISAEAVAVALGRDYSRAAVGRYTASARVASKSLERLITIRPEWEREAGSLKTARAAVDAAHFTDLRSMGLL